MACEPPVRASDPSMGAAEVADVQNRARWLACIERHSAWLQCAAALIDRGLLARPQTQNERAAK
jgi:hypothetical protein